MKDRNRLVVVGGLAETSEGLERYAQVARSVFKEVTTLTLREAIQDADKLARMAKGANYAGHSFGATVTEPHKLRVAGYFPYSGGEPSESRQLAAASRRKKAGYRQAREDGHPEADFIKRMNRGNNKEFLSHLLFHTKAMKSLRGLSTVENVLSARQEGLATAYTTSVNEGYFALTAINAARLMREQVPIHLLGGPDGPQEIAALLDNPRTNPDQPVFGEYNPDLIDGHDFMYIYPDQAVEEVFGR